MTNFIMPSQKIQKDIRNIISNIHKNIIGRIADLDDNVFQLACLIASEEDGDHLEIGVLHGGTAILIALLKKELGHKGIVYCIDPLDGYYKDTVHDYVVDPVSFVPVSLDVLVKNIYSFDVEKEIIILKCKSIPWPSVLNDKTFSTAFIDGDHWGDAPTTDWENVHKLTTGTVIFDNYDHLHPAVIAAGRMAYENPEWDEIFDDGIVYAVKRNTPLT